MLRHQLDNSKSPVDLGPQPRILFIKLATAGDLLLLTPAIRAVRDRYPDAELDLLTTPDAAPLLADSPLVNAVYTLDLPTVLRPSSLVSDARSVLANLMRLLAVKRRRYAAVLLCHHLTLAAGRFKYRAMLQILRPRYAIGLDNSHGKFLDVRVRDDGFGAKHEAEYGLALARATGATTPARRNISVRDLGWPVPVGGSQRPARITLHAGSGTYSVARRWPAEQFARLARMLHDATGAQIVLVGSAAEVALNEHILALMGSPAWAHSTAGERSFAELAGDLGECSLFVGNDSFPMHLAAAAGIPVVAIFGPSNAGAWQPFVPDTPSRTLTVRRTDLPCSPCFYVGHRLGTPQGCPARPCLTELEADTVFRAALRLLDLGNESAVPAD